MLSKRNKEALFNPLSKDNPVLVQILGICSTLAVTAKLEPAIVMGISVIAVLAISNVVISLLRKTIPTSIRIIVQLVVVAALVIIVQQVLRAYAYDVTPTRLPGLSTQGQRWACPGRASVCYGRAYKRSSRAESISSLVPSCHRRPEAMSLRGSTAGQYTVVWGRRAHSVPHGNPRFCRIG